MIEPVSVIIPTFNRARYLRPCIEAVLNQSRPPAEVLVVDDGSTDNTAEVVQEFGDSVRYLAKPNSGKSASLNLALTHTSHPVIWIMDDDDIASPKALETLSNLLDENPDAGMAFGRFDRFVKDEKTGERTFFPTYCWVDTTPATFLPTALEDCFVHQPGMLVRRSVYDKTGPFNVELMRSQDYDMLVRIARITSCVSSGDIVFHQRQHDGARGQAGRQFDETRRMNTWVSYDQKIFEPLYHEMPLADFLAKGTALDTPEAERRARLQRATVMARKKLWRFAVADLKTAATLSKTPLTAEETAIIRRCFGAKNGSDEVGRDLEVSAALLTLKDVAPSGPQISRALARGLVWKLRDAVRSRQHDVVGRLGRLSLSLALPGLNAFRTARKQALKSS
ncbi:MAG: glycosyltransferase family 2 protein [Pseudomonadota bacterium]